MSTLLAPNDVGDALHELLPEVSESEFPRVVLMAHIKFKQTRDSNGLLTDARAYYEQGNLRLLRLNDTRLPASHTSIPTHIQDFLEDFASYYRKVGV